MFVFYVLFIGIAMACIFIFDNRPNEMLGFALWGGIMYALISVAPWLYVNSLIIKKVDDVNRNTKQWFAGLIILGVFIFFAAAGGGKPLIFLATVVIYTVSFLLATLLTSLIRKVVTNVSS